MRKVWQSFVGVVLVLVLPSCLCIPAEPHYFDQVVDHFSAPGVPLQTFKQRYYTNDTYFGGAGYPIFMILGGEGAITPQTGIYYPYIVELAAQFGALVVEPEHRFYGTSLPADPTDVHNLRLLTPQQALEDAATLLVSIQHHYNCSSSSQSSLSSCPVLTIGGSYPGFLSAAMRIRYPALVNFAYAASAPLRFYSQQVDEFAYYKKISDSAESASAGCADAVRFMLQQTIGAASTTLQQTISNLQLCSPLPSYITTMPILRDEINMIVMYSFANLNMAAYPPPNTTLQAACQAIQRTVKQPWQALTNFLKGYSLHSSLQHDDDSDGLPDFFTTAAAAVGRATQFHRRARLFRRYTGHSFPSSTSSSSFASCYDLSSQLPAGPNATISSGDWSGVGTGLDGQSWDFETCTFMIERIGTNSVSDMFLAREWTIEWLQQHCQSRFNVQPQPTTLADLWAFHRLQDIGTSHIFFTNGDEDGWSVGGIQESIPSREIYVYNLPNGAHHSDLGHVPPSDDDTPDIKQVHADFADLLTKWLQKSTL